MQPVKDNSEVHNFRKIVYDYVRQDLTIENESWSENSISERKKIINLNCKKLSGRKLQSNAKPIREAVVNIKANTSMSDLKRLSKVFLNKMNIHTFQVHIHRDEGRYDPLSQIWKPNYHAHLLFDIQDKKKGTTLKFSKKDLSLMQDITAEVLGMERGVSSSRERLSAVDYKLKRKSEDLKKLMNEIELKKSEVLIEENKLEEFYNLYRELEEEIEESSVKLDFLNSILEDPRYIEVRLKFEKHIFNSKKHNF